MYCVCEDDVSLCLCIVFVKMMFDSVCEEDV